MGDYSSGVYDHALFSIRGNQCHAAKEAKPRALSNSEFSVLEAERLWGDYALEPAARTGLLSHGEPQVKENTNP